MLWKITQNFLTTIVILYTAANRIRKAREIKNFKQDQKINKDLFELALEYAN